MDVFRRLQKSKPAAVELLFATHPLSEERYQTALARLAGNAGAAAGGTVRGRERYLDMTASLRAMADVIESLQFGETALMAQKPAQAEPHLARALRQAPGDYAALLMMAKCLLAEQKAGEAVRYAEQAKAVYPGEPQAYHVAGMAKVSERRFDAALQEFAAYEKVLPGNPNTVFFEGYCCESMGRRSDSAALYGRYLEAAPSGEYSTHARQRLIEWGYIKPAGTSS
jgi:tetratricopeptide (TPR) repeat protein